MRSTLRLADVWVRRGRRAILSNVNWDVREGEHWVVLGPNGAGKTTLLQLVAGRMYPSSGSVEVLGSRLGQIDVAELRTRVGFASSALADRLNPSEWVRDVVLSAAYGMTGRWRETYDTQDTERANVLLHALGVGALGERRFHTLSEGEKKRVQVARALMSDPELLLLDESAAGLDLSGRELLLRALDEIVQDPHSPGIVLVTHHVEEIPAAFTHGLLLREGHVVAGGPLAEVMSPQLLSETFGLPLEVDTNEGRFTARAKRVAGRGMHVRTEGY